MRRTTNLFRMIPLCICVALVAALAPARSALAQTKIATIEINAVLDKLTEKAQREQELQEYLAVLQNRMDSMRQDLESKQKELDVLPQGDPEYQTTAEDIIRKSIALEGEGKLAQALAEKKRKEIQLALFKKITDATGRYAQREGIGIVMADDSKEEIPNDATAKQVQGAILSQKIIWANASLDISSAVAGMMNNEYTAGN